MPDEELRAALAKLQGEDDVALKSLSSVDECSGAAWSALELETYEDLRRNAGEPSSSSRAPIVVPPRFPMSSGSAAAVVVPARNVPLKLLKCDCPALIAAVPCTHAGFLRYNLSLSSSSPDGDGAGVIGTISRRSTVKSSCRATRATLLVTKLELRRLAWRSRRPELRRRMYRDLVCAGLMCCILQAPCRGHFELA